MQKIGRIRGSIGAWAVLLGLGVLVGCGGGNARAPIGLDRLGKLVVDETTRPEAVGLLGQPDGVATAPDGRGEWLFYAAERFERSALRATWQLLSLQEVERRRNVRLQFDEQGVLREMTGTE